MNRKDYYLTKCLPRLFGVDSYFKDHDFDFPIVVNRHNPLSGLFRPLQRDLAENDGLLPEDFEEWFKSYDLSKEMAIIHFTKFRY